MKTAEITRQKTAASGVKAPSTWALFAQIYKREGLAGVNKGVNAVAVRQCTNWGSRYAYHSYDAQVRIADRSCNLAAWDSLV